MSSDQRAEIPAFVEALPPAEQVAWFAEHKVGAMPESEWGRYYPSSVQHRGLHCGSCIDDINEGYQDWDEDKCCCKAYR